jgi:hypothetical protein
MNEEYMGDEPEEQDEEPDSSDSQLQFNVSISTDRDKFLRRTCPSCGRDFKTSIDPADLAWALSAQIKRMGLEIGAVPAGEGEDTPQLQLLCPYCHHGAEGSEMHTEETIEYLKRFVYRDYVVPMINKTFSDLEDSIGRGGGGGGGGGFISVSMSFEHEPIPIPPRPMHGPEPADMKIVDFLCCGKQMKVADSWMDVSECIYCRTQVALI